MKQRELLCSIHISKLNLRASRSRVSRVEINHQRLLGSRTLEGLAVLVYKSKVWGSLSNRKVKSSLLPWDSRGWCESRCRAACDGGDEGGGLHDYMSEWKGFSKNFMTMICGFDDPLFRRSWSEFVGKKVTHRIDHRSMSHSRPGRHCLFYTNFMGLLSWQPRTLFFSSFLLASHTSRVLAEHKNHEINTLKRHKK